MRKQEKYLTEMSMKNEIISEIVKKDIDKHKKFIYNVLSVNELNNDVNERGKKMGVRIKLELGDLYQEEIDVLNREMDRVQKKYETTESSCGFDIVSSPSRFKTFEVVLRADRRALAAFIIEQLI
jgi:hypothetical protein